MSARQKLNKAFFGGSLFLASIAGAATGSWIVFGVALAALVSSNLWLGEIRPSRRRR
jgi:hypothetical protein